MNEQDLEQLREVHAGLAMVGLLMKGVYDSDIPTRAYQLADSMLTARSESAGIVSVKRHLKKEKAHDSN
jgi:hypothetical protein